MNIKDHRVLIGFISFVFLASLISIRPIPAQRISPDIKPPKTSTKNEPSRQGTSGRIIPPEEFGKFRNQKRRRKLSQDALIEKLRADSASMRIRFQEKLRKIRSDSQQMRSRIEKLIKRLTNLRNKLAKLRKKSRNTAEASQQIEEEEKEESPVASGSGQTDTKIASGEENTPTLEETNMKEGSTTTKSEQTVKKRDRVDTPGKADEKIVKKTDNQSQKLTTGENRRKKQVSNANQKSDTTDRTSEKREGTQDNQSSVTESKDTKSEKPASTVSSNSLNPNRASMRELRALPGIDKLLAERIIWYRSEVKFFRKKQDLIRVPGIGRSLYNQIQLYFVDGPYR